MCVSLMIGWLLVSLAYNYYVPTYSIPSTSMLPTLAIGDYVFAVKRPWRERLPARGEIVIFTAPDGNEYVKRVVGLPGDRIELSHGIVLVNGVAARRERIGPCEPADGEPAAAGTVRYRETLPGGLTHAILERSDEEPLDSVAPLTVPDGHIFVLGDNRDNSADSRVASVGPVPLERLLDKPLCIYWARDRARIGAIVR